MTRIAIVCVICLCTLYMSTTTYAGDPGVIDPAYKYGWGENLGWINYAPTGASSEYLGLIITDTAITGYAWSSVYGWINFAPSTGGVTNSCTGVLGGYAWSSQKGWIPMGGVVINSSGRFTGVGGSTDFEAGRITFDCDHCDVRTDWRHCEEVGGGGGSSVPVPPPPSEPPPSDPSPDDLPPPPPPMSDPPSDEVISPPPSESSPDESLASSPPASDPPSDEVSISSPDESLSDDSPPDGTGGPTTDPDTSGDLSPTGSGDASTVVPDGTGVSHTIVSSTAPPRVIQEVAKSIQFVTGVVKSLVIGVRDIIAKTTLGESSSEVYEQVQRVINNSEVERVNETRVVPVIATTAIANIAVATSVSAGFELSQAGVYLKFLFTQPLLFLRRRKQKKWGVVYNSYTKQPIDLATVRLVDAISGKVLRTQVTDIRGRYFFVSHSGDYRIDIHKDGFIGGSEYLRNLSEDTSFTNLYHGEKFTIDDESVEINYNIPLDPDLDKKTNLQLLKESARMGAHQSMTMIGGVATVGALIVSPSMMIVVLLIAHVMIYFFIRGLSHRKIEGTYGVITDNDSKKPIKNSIIRVYDATYNKLVETAITDTRGRYAVLVGPSTYYITIEKKGYERFTSPKFDFSSQKTGGLGGLIAESFSFTSRKVE